MGKNYFKQMHFLTSFDYGKFTIFEGQSQCHYIDENNTFNS